MGGWLQWAAVVGCAMSLAACGRGVVDDRRIEAPAAGDWLTYGRTYDEQRFSPLTEVNRQTVGRLGVAWWAQFDTDRGQEATPLVADGVLYTTTAWSKLYAFDAKTGRQLWSYDPRVPGEKGFDACCDVVNRGVALWKGRVYLGALDGRLIALDAKTGKPAWMAQVTDPKLPYTITGAPRAVKGLIVIGNGGAEYPVRGYVSAFDAATGKLVWRFYMTPNPKGEPDNAASDKIMQAKAAATWGDGAWKLGGGGATPWDPITYDARSDLIFVGVGNPGPWNAGVRGKGDNLFADSIVALRPETGEYVWHYQTTPGDDWDFDATQHLMVADLPIGGKTQRVVMQANKNGFFYVLAAASGRLLSAEKYVPVTWADHVDLASGRPVEAKDARYEGRQGQRLVTPGPAGGHNWQPMAFSPTERLVYIPAQIWYTAFAGDPNFKYVPGLQNTGLGSLDVASPQAPKPEGELVAWDPVAGKARWTASFPQPWRSGVLATAGGLVFHAAGHTFKAFDAATGKVLWSYDVGASPIAAASTYAIDGEQYVALMVGYGGAAGFFDTEPRRPGRLLVFKLGGTVRPTPFPARPAPRPLDLSAAKTSRGDKANGEALFNQFCGNCHSGTGYLPDLRTSPAILEPTAFKAIVVDGARTAQGMAPFQRFFGAAGAEDIRAYLLRWAAAPPKPVEMATHRR